MLSYCVKCKDKLLSRQKGKVFMLLPNWAVCGSRKSRFIKEKEISGWLGSLAKSFVKFLQ